MNIFVLDRSPERAARAHCDKHIAKMVLESAQMLSTVVGGPYKPTHKNHPCTKWVAESRQNAEWLWLLADALNIEYKERYNRTQEHKSWAVMEPLWRDIKNLPDAGLTPFAQAMPEEFKNNDAVTAYRNYYRSKSFAKWAHSEAPSWW